MLHEPLRMQLPSDASSYMLPMRRHQMLLLLLLQVQDLALQFLTAWAAAGQAQAQLLSQQGLAPALGRLAMDAVAQGELGRELQASVCR
jgi:hypothetical protein